jgi:hypothetical protein
MLQRHSVHTATALGESDIEAQAAYHGLLTRRVCHMSQPPPISATAAATKSATDMATLAGVH